MSVIVYIHTNKISGKSYIGFTTLTLNERWNGHVNCSKNAKLYFHKAIHSYGHGDDVWEHRILSEYSTVEEAKNSEIEWIAKLNTNHRDFGYNLTSGGDGVVPNEETRLKMSQSQRNRPQMSDETKQKLREAFTGDKNPNFGKSPSFETRQKQISALKGKKRAFYQRKKGAKRTIEQCENISKNRKGKCVGSNHPMFNGHPRQKLTEVDVVFIKSCDATITNRELAILFEMNEASIRGVRLGNVWKHVRPDLNKTTEQLMKKKRKKEPREKRKT